MGKTLIIGCGNPLRNDDGVGYAIAERLGAIMRTPMVRVLARQQLTAELAMEMTEADRVIIIDAAVGGPPGCVSVQKVQPADWPISTLTHELRPSMLLAYSRGLYGSNPETFLVSITGKSFEFGDQISDAVASSLPNAIRHISELITAKERV